MNLMSLKRVFLAVRCGGDHVVKRQFDAVAASHCRAVSRCFNLLAALLSSKTAVE